MQQAQPAAPMNAITAAATEKGVQSSDDEKNKTINAVILNTSAEVVESWQSGISPSMAIDVQHHILCEKPEDEGVNFSTLKSSPKHTSGKKRDDGPTDGPPGNIGLLRARHAEDADAAVLSASQTLFTPIVEVAAKECADQTASAHQLPPTTPPPPPPPHKHLWPPRKMHVNKSSAPIHGDGGHSSADDDDQKAKNA